MRRFFAVFDDAPPALRAKIVALYVVLIAVREPCSGFASATYRGKMTPPTR